MERRYSGEAPDEGRIACELQGLIQIVNMLGLVERLDMWESSDHLPGATYHRRGSIYLLGDAAHAFTRCKCVYTHHGAGSGMAMEDTFVLSKFLASIQSGTAAEGLCGL